MIIIPVNMFAHENYYESIELSNVHLKIEVSNENSIQLRIAKSYSRTINDYVRKFYPTQKVFIQFCEGDFIYMNYGSFMNNIVPEGFPFSIDYNLGFLSNSEGLNIFYSQNNFKLRHILSLIKYGFHNIDSLKHKKYLSKIKMTDIVTESYINSLLKHDLDSICKGILNRRIEYFETPFTLKKRNLELVLRNDSFHIENYEMEKILSFPNLHLLLKANMSNSIFIFDTNDSFYYINSNLKTNKVHYSLKFKKHTPFDEITIEYCHEQTKYKITESDFFDNKRWVYFNSENGICCYGEKLNMNIDN